jgi:hypothetical protein
MKPEMPASASWTTEIWPTKPVITTSGEAHDRRQERRDQRLPKS